MVKPFDLLKYSMIEYNYIKTDLNTFMFKQEGYLNFEMATFTHFTAT